MFVSEELGYQNKAAICMLGVVQFAKLLTLMQPRSKSKPDDSVWQQKH